MDVHALERATGWRIHAHAALASTNDAAADLRRSGARGCTAVIADQQGAGRGRAGRTFDSPVGGLYLSALLPAAPADLPARIVALAAVALAESLEAMGVAEVQIKWPNDIWIGGKKVAGILVEAAEGEPLVVVGMGLNLRRVPTGLPADTACRVTAVDLHLPAPVDRDALVERLLGRLGTWSQRLSGGTSAALEAAWVSRLALLGARVQLGFAGRSLKGVFEAAALDGGLLIRDDAAGPVWREAALAYDLGPA